MTPADAMAWLLVAWVTAMMIGCSIFAGWCFYKALKE